MTASLLAGRVALVTGAGQGLGRAIATEFASEGATVVLVDRNATSLEEALEAIRSSGGRAEAFELDVTDYARFEQIVAETTDSHGPVDVLVNNAAVCFPSSILSSDAGWLEQWRTQLTVNLEAVCVGVRLVAPGMIRSGSGRVINVSSINAFVSAGRWAAYDAAKGGIAALTKSMAVELAPHNILANAILPGFMRTPMSVIDGVDETTTADFMEWNVRRRHIPLGRAGTPEDVAGLAVFLSSDYCRYLTGQLIVVDGGMTSRTGYEELQTEEVVT